MGLTGRTPKHDDERIRRNAPIYDKIQVEWDGVVRGPDLPSRWVPCDCNRVGSGPHPDYFTGPCREYVNKGWHPAAIAWYEEWRRTPQSMVFVDTDWMFFHQTALLVEEYWDEDCKKTERVSLAGEIRRREEGYGGTFEARRKLRLEIRSPQHDLAKQQQVVDDAKNVVNYVEMLNKAAADVMKDES